MKAGYLAIPIILSFVLGVLPGCRATGPACKIDPPQGFAVYSKDTESFRSIASDGVRIRIRRVDNNPRGDAAMWEQAVAAYLADRGYHRVSGQKLISKSGLEGLFTEYAYWYNAEEYRYTITIFADKENIYLAEAGGTAESFAGKRKDVLASLQSFTLQK